jgi:hypothetical protein
VISTDQVRKLALALPDAVQQDHHGRPSLAELLSDLFLDAWENKAPKRIREARATPLGRR